MFLKHSINAVLLKGKVNSCGVLEAGLAFPKYMIFSLNYFDLKVHNVHSI